MCIHMILDKYIIIINIFFLVDIFIIKEKYIFLMCLVVKAGFNIKMAKLDFFISGNYWHFPQKFTYKF